MRREQAKEASNMDVNQKRSIVFTLIEFLAKQGLSSSEATECLNDAAKYINASEQRTFSDGGTV